MDNVLFHSDPSNGIAAILDWELSTLGDGLSDLAYVSSTDLLSGLTNLALSCILSFSLQSIHEGVGWSGLNFDWNSHSPGSNQDLLESTRAALCFERDSVSSFCGGV